MHKPKVVHVIGHKNSSSLNIQLALKKFKCLFKCLSAYILKGNMFYARYKLHNDNGLIYIFI